METNRKIIVPTERDIRCNSLAQQCGDRTHKIDANNYCEASILLSSDDYERLYEAVLVTVNFLSYNGIEKTGKPGKFASRFHIV